jgi:hypothetical protein
MGKDITNNLKKKDKWAGNDMKSYSKALMIFKLKMKMVAVLPCSTDRQSIKADSTQHSHLREGIGGIYCLQRGVVQHCTKGWRWVDFRATQVKEGRAL